MFYKLFFITFFLLICTSSVHPQKYKEITWATPEWDGYTNKDGSGIYNEIIKKIFNKKGIRVRIIYLPWKRSLYMIKTGKFDISGADETLTTNFLFSNKPVILTQEYIFFKKIKKPEFTKNNFHFNTTGAWIRGYLDNSKLKNLKGIETNQRESAAKMVLSGRADYYLDNLYQMNKTLKILNYHKTQYSKKSVIKVKLYFLFSRNNRGYFFKQIFDEEFLKMHKEGTLKKIYYKYQLNEKYPF